MREKNYTLKEIDIVYKPLIEMVTRPKITCAEDAVKVFRENWDDMKIGIQEQFKVMYLNRGNKILGITNLSTGGMSGTVVDPKVLFAMALKVAASAVILAHNHPSGNLTPSDEDKRLTQKLEQVGKLLDITVLDHVILSGLDNSAISMNNSNSIIIDDSAIRNTLRL
jgi:DNA repair protein RadC